VIILDRENEVWDVPGHLQHLMEHWDFTRGRHKAVVDFVIGQITTESILDVGCGIGFLPYELRELGKKLTYVGMDNSKVMLADAIKRFPELKDFFVFGDVYDMSNFSMFPSVVCIDIIMHLPDPLDLPIKEMWKHAEKELIFTARVDKKFIYYMDYSGNFVLPEGKFLISRADLHEDFISILNTLDDTESIGWIDYDERTRVYRIVRNKHV
jgi:2-polyprenyl-3-methyl-5-hydroxy-6-metoxy-1,4-benzoquinol methylase